MIFKVKILLRLQHTSLLLAGGSLEVPGYFVAGVVAMGAE